MRQNKIIERIVEQYWYSVACQEGMGNIVVYQNVWVHGMISLGKKHI